MQDGDIKKIVLEIEKLILTIDFSSIDDIITSCIEREIIAILKNWLTKVINYIKEKNP